MSYISTLKDKETCNKPVIVYRHNLTNYAITTKFNNLIYEHF